MDTKKYIMWNEGVVSSFGELISKDETTITVKNPVVVVFSAVNEPVIDNNGNVVMDAKGQPVMKGSLNWDMNPYIFGVCLKDSSCNIWTTTPKSVISEDAEYDERLVKHYETLIHLCDKGAVPVENTETTDSETTTEA